VSVWSWDITKLPGPHRGDYFDCYVIIDIFSRYVVGWTVAASEDSTIAKNLLADAIARQDVGRDQLTLHADRGTSMTSKTVAQLLEDLGVTRTHGRPHVSDDNPSTCVATSLVVQPGGRGGSIQSVVKVSVPPSHFGEFGEHGGSPASC
jgi:transposase InsO family protein